MYGMFTCKPKEGKYMPLMEHVGEETVTCKVFLA